MLQNPEPSSGMFQRYTRVCWPARTARRISCTAPKSEESDWRKRQLRPIASSRAKPLTRTKPSEIQTSGASSPRKSETEKATLEACSAAVITFWSIRQPNQRHELGTQCTKRSASSTFLLGCPPLGRVLESTPAEPAKLSLLGAGD